MSDDTPTQKFDAAGDAPTERLVTPEGEAVPLEVVEERKSRRLVLILGIIGGVLLIGVIVLLVALLTRGQGTPTALPTPSMSSSTSPSASPTPSVTPSESPSPTPTETVAPPPPPPAPSTDPAVDSFTINPQTVDCSSGGSKVITIKWFTSNANFIYFGVDTADASTGPFFGDSLPASGTSTNDFPNGYRPFEYTCGNGSHTYVITAVSADGNKKDTATIKVTG